MKFRIDVEQQVTLIINRKLVTWWTLHYVQASKEKNKTGWSKERQSPNY